LAQVAALARFRRQGCGVLRQRVVFSTLRTPPFRFTIMATLPTVLCLMAMFAAEAHKPVSWAGFLHIEDHAMKANPITKVVNQLETLQEELKAEQEKDEEAYEKMQCWCENGETIKKKSIADAENNIATLPPIIEANAAKAKQVTTELEQLRSDLVKNEEALKESQSMRYKEAEDFTQEERDAEDTIRGCKLGIKVLGTNHDAALPQEAMLQVKQVLKRHKVLEPAMLEKLGGIDPEKRKMVLSLVEKNPHKQEYAPQSSEILGVLKTMLEEFEENLKTMTAEEENAKAAFAELKPAKEAEMRAQNKQVREKLAQKVKADKAAEDAKLDMKESINVKEVDEQALLDIKERCPKMDQEFETRTKFRQEETKAVSEAMKILTDDDARTAMHRSTTLMQLQSKVAGHRGSTKLLSLVTKKLLTVAKKHAVPELALIALAVKDDVFGKVKESIDTMIAQLNQQEKDEFKQRDFCNAELHQNTLDLDEKYHDKENQEAKIADLNAQIERLANEIKVARAEIADTQIEMKQAFEAREAENKEFSIINADQQLAQATLQKALNKLNDFYRGSNEVPQLLQKSASTQRLGQPNYHAKGSGGEGPEGFEKQEKSSGGGKVMTMIEEILHESAEEMTETASDEHESQVAHEEYGRMQNKVIQARQKEIATKTEEKAAADEDLVATKADYAQTGKDLEELHAYESGIHRECDFLLDNFQARRDARVEEIEALSEAKSMMSGMA